MKYKEIFPLPIDWLQDVDQSLADTAMRWAEQEVMAKRLEHEEDYEKMLLPAMCKLLVDIGMQGMVWPEDAGGSGIDSPALALTMTAVIEQVARGDVGIGCHLANLFAVSSAIGVQPNRDHALLRKLSTLFCGDQPAIVSLVLPGLGLGGRDARPEFNGLKIPTTATKKEHGWMIQSDHVRPQLAGADGKLFGVMVQTENGEIALALVNGDAEGLRRGETIRQTGLAASRNAELSLHDVFIEDKLLICRGEKRIHGLLSWYYLGCSACALGALLTTYEIIRDWGDARVIKGKRQVFKNNPLTASLMGDIAMCIGVDRLLTYHLAYLLSKPDVYGEAGDSAIFATANAVLDQVTQSAMAALDNTMELMASAGYAVEWQLERYWRDMKTLETYLGPPTAAQMNMAGHAFGSRVE